MLGFCDVTIKFLHFLFACPDIRRPRGQKQGTFGGAEIGRVVIDVPQKTRIRQPAIANLTSHSVKISQACHAEDAQKGDDQQEEKKS